MLPGVVAGHSRREEAEFDVALLAERAYAEFIPATVEALDATARTATLSDGRQLSFDIASLNAGSRTDDSVPGSREHALSVKPFERLVGELQQVSHVAVAGGGAGGAELAMALRHRGGEVTLYSEHMSFPPELAKRVVRVLRRRRGGFLPRPPLRSGEACPGVPRRGAPPPVCLVPLGTRAGPPARACPEGAPAGGSPVVA